MEILKLNSQQYPFKDSGLDQDWWIRFMRDHPELLFCTPQELSEA
ncbi:11312_t:CDS:1, partial [Acaulospora morrowiae]